jgi:hypothetical protein
MPTFVGMTVGVGMMVGVGMTVGVDMTVGVSMTVGPSFECALIRGSNDGGTVPRAGGKHRAAHSLTPPAATRPGPTHRSA